MIHAVRSHHLIARTVAVAAFAVSFACVQAQTAAARQTGTVKSIDGTTLTVTTAAGAAVAVSVAADAAVVQMAPGVTDLKTATPIKMADIVVGDKVITGKNGDTDTASRVIVIKNADIAARNQAEQADWQKRGTGGIIKSVDGSVLTISSGAKTIKVETTPKTVFRRYAADSIKFQDATKGDLAQVHAGDQLSVRGDKNPDGSSIAAEEVVTGTFANLSGALSAVDAAAGTITLKDLTTKKIVVIHVTANSDVHTLPPQMATMFAARATPAGGAPGSAPSGPPAGAPGGAGGPGGPGGGAGGAGRARAGMDLSRMLSRLPATTVAQLHPKDAVMVVASPGSNPDTFTAITLLSGVDALLSAPAGAAPITLSPWSLGAPGGEGGGGAGPQ